MAGRGHGGHAAIHAARARKYKAQLDAIREALLAEGFPVEDADEEGLAKAVGFLAGKVRELQEALNEAEFEAAAPGSSSFSTSSEA